MKIGDRVLVNGEVDGLVFNNEPGVIKNFLKRGPAQYLVRFDSWSRGHGEGCREWCVNRYNLTVIPNSSVFIISVVDMMGRFAPSATPKVYKTRAEADRVATEMADKYGGKFVIFQAVGHAEAPARPKATVVTYH